MLRHILVVSLLGSLAVFSTGCVQHSGFLPMQNHSTAEFSENNFDVVGTNLRGEASVVYLLQIIPTSDPAVATRAMNELINSSGSDGKTRALAAFTPDRLELFSDAPTFKELGKDFVYFMQRSVVGAPGMSKEAEDYYRGVFQKVFNSEEWQTYRKKKSLYGDFLTGGDLKAYWKRERDIHQKMLKDIGEI